MWVTDTRYYGNLNWLSVWYDRSSLGFVKPTNLLEILLSFGNTIIKDPSWVYRLAVLTIVFMGSLGVYEYIKHLTKDSAASLVGALFYVLNLWVLNEIGGGHIDIIAGVGLFPLFLWSFEKRKIVLASLFACAFLTAVSPEMIYAFGIFFIAYLFVTFSLDRKKSNVIYLLIVSVLSFGLSMFYIVPFIWVNGFSGYAGLSAWTIEDIQGFIMLPWQAVMCLVAVSVLAFFVLKYGKEYKYAHFFAVAAVLSTLLAASPTFPVLNNLYIWMFTNVPFFSMFRVPTRLMVVTIFCVAYMLGVVAARSGSLVSEVKIPFMIRKIPKSRICRAIVACVIILTFVFSAVAFPLQAGAISWPGNYTPAPSWISNYEWLGSQPGNLWSVYTLPITGGWITTPYGVTQDYGALSTLLSGKSVIGVPSTTASSYPFLQYLQYLAENNVTDQWLKLLGAADVKYITTEPTIDNQEAFLVSQEGMGRDMLVYSDGDANVYENPYWISMFEVVSDVNLLAGGYNTVLSLLRNSFNFSSDALFFMNPDGNESVVNASSVIYENFMDYLLLTLPKTDGIKISAYQFGVDYTSDPEKNWIKDDNWKIEGLSVFNEYTLSVSGEQAGAIQFNAEESGTYDVYARILAGPSSDRGNLTIGDTTVHPSWGTYSFQWYNFGEANLTKGQNTLQIENSGGRDDIDEIILVKPVVFENYCENAIRELQNSSMGIIFTNRAYNIFNVTTGKNWEIEPVQLNCDGNVLYSAGGGELAFKLDVGNAELSDQDQTIILPRSGDYTILLRAKINGSILLQIDNETSLIASANGSGAYRTYNFSMLHLNDGEHSVRLSFNGTTYLDDITIYSAITYSNSLEKVFQSEESNGTVLVDKINPTEYVLDAKSNINESYLIMSASFDNLWKAYINNVEISPIRINDVLIGFPLNETGDFQIRIVFTGQTYVAIGYYLTAASFSVILIVLAIEYVKNKKAKEKQPCG
jgi:hypothetical protein